MIINQTMAQSIQQLGQATSSQSTQRNKVQHGGSSFKDVLAQQLNEKNEIKFSKHASMRLETRHIQFDANQLERIQHGLDSARGKGVKESLMLVDDVALIVNVDNATVITALNKDETKEHVFTNIDGALLL